MSPLTPSRRTLLRTAAWSVPAVTVAAAAPAFASSAYDIRFDGDLENDPVFTTKTLNAGQLQISNHGTTDVALDILFPTSLHSANGAMDVDLTTSTFTWGRPQNDVQTHLLSTGTLQAGGTWEGSMRWTNYTGMGPYIGTVIVRLAGTTTELGRIDLGYYPT